MIFVKYFLNCLLLGLGGAVVEDLGYYWWVVEGVVLVVVFGVYFFFGGYYVIDVGGG